MAKNAENRDLASSMLNDESHAKTNKQSLIAGKRSWADEVEQSELTQKRNNIPFSGPKFLIVSLTNKDLPLSKASPFLIQKGLEGIGGQPKSVKKLRSGDILIEVQTAIQAKSFLIAKTLGTIPITVSPHKTLNTSRGVISEPDLLNCSEEEIKTELAPQNVINVKRITIRRNENIIQTKHLILTFNSPDLPKYVTAGYLNCSIRPYIPNPMRCFQCQRFGHSKVSCRGQETCSNCSEIGHKYTECSNDSKCVNCQGSHPSNSKLCPKWVLEKQIQTIKIKNNVPYPEARKIVINSQPTNKPTYAAVTKNVMKSVETQTDIKNPSKPILNRNSSVSSTIQSKTNTKETISKVQSTNSAATIIKKRNDIKKKLLKQKLKRQNENCSSDEERSVSDTSMDATMEVEPGMESPPHLHPKINKNSGTKIFSAS